MDENLWIVVAGVMVGVIFLIFERRRSSKELPPGPTRLPIIGNLHQFGGLIHVALAKMAKEHGPIMTVWFGMDPKIILSDYEGAWEVLVRKASDFSARSLPYSSKIITADWRTITTSDFGPYWQSLRRGIQGSALNPSSVSLQTHLREADLAAMIKRLQEEASSSKDGIVHPLIHIRLNIVRVTARLCFGSDFTNEEFVTAINTAIIDASRLGRHTSFLDSFPFTRHIPVLGKAIKMAHEINGRVASLIDAQVSRYVSSLGSPSPNCYLHFLLSQNYPREVLLSLLFEMFLLSVDSTSWTTAWALAFLIHDQQAQRKLYDEVSREGDVQGETVSLQQVGKMQYLHAVMKETMRLKPFAPLAVPHKAVKDTTLGGMKIAKGTTVIVNLYPVHRDPRVWDEPDRFMPERFLNPHGVDDDGAMKAMEQAFLPFGAGRRMCTGMDLAKHQVGLTLANLVKKFEWCAVSEDGPDLSEHMSTVITMKTPIVARIRPRPGASMA